MNTKNSNIKFLAKHFNLLFLDTETTGLDPTTEKIIDLGVIGVDADGNVTEKMNSLIKLGEDETLSEEITELTHITNEMLNEKGENRQIVRRKFSELITKSIKPTLILAYNLQFDASFLAKFMLIPKGFKLNIHWMDIMTLYKEIFPYPHKLCNAIETYSLEDEVVNSHRALDDTYACFKVFEKIMETRDLEDVLEHIDVLGYNAKYGLPEYLLSSVTNGSKNKVIYVPQNQAGTDKVNDTGVVDLTYIEEEKSEYKITTFSNQFFVLKDNLDDAINYLNEQNKIVGPIYNKVVNLKTDAIEYDYLKNI